MSPSLVECESRIERVVVYARGAVVTRRLILPAELPESAVDLRVPGITARADAGSVRALAEGDREVVALKARVVVPEAPATPGELTARWQKLDRDLVRLEAERSSLRELRGALAGAKVDPALRKWARRIDPAARFGDALAVSALIDGETDRADAALRALDETIERTRRERDAARLAASQGSTSQTDGERVPSLEVLVRLAQGSGVPASLLVEYAVRAARWWPAYTARFSAAATKVSLALDAFVAQASGEDWSRVKLSLSTADLSQDARLPVLRSLRFGRAQPAPKRGYRPPPPGLDAMFAGHDRATTIEPEEREKDVSPKDSLEDLSDEMFDSFQAMPKGGAQSLTRAGSLGGAIPTSASYGAPMPAAAPAPQPEAAMPARKSAGPMRMRARADMARSVVMEEAEDGRGGGGPMPRSEPDLPVAIEPTDAWLDFDALVLGDPEDRMHRGRLVRVDSPRPISPASAPIQEPDQAIDPLADRGRFDHRYDAEGTAEVPSSGRPHRVSVATAEGSATPRFTAVPREAPEVYREVEIQNPFDAPLLAGPVDVFLDGALMTTDKFAFVDRKGTLRLGLGVEDRLRVARNARVEEGSAGLLGGTTTVDHRVTIDLASSLGTKVTVEVIERAPVTDDKDVEIKITASKPEHERYTQAERGTPLRRGLRFRVEVPAGDKAKIEYAYRVTLPAKNEIVGGNRRE